jgi:CRISPR type IV-associated protein Csf1
MALEVIAPTQFIRLAALKTPRVQAAMGKAVDYADVPLANVPDARCWLCGGETGGRGQPVKKVIKDTFTDRDKARWPASGSICPGCAFCLSYPTLRNYSILATAGGLRHPGRAEIREILLDPPEPPFVLCIAVSGQKWLHFRAQAAYDRDGYPVQFEETPVCVWRKPLADWLEMIELLYGTFSKEEIRTGRYGQNRIKQFGLAEFQIIENLLAPHRGTRLFELAVFVAQKPEDADAKETKEEKPCSTTLIRTTGGQLQLPF